MDKPSGKRGSSVPGMPMGAHETADGCRQVMDKERHSTRVHDFGDPQVAAARSHAAAVRNELRGQPRVREKNVRELQADKSSGQESNATTSNARCSSTAR